MDANQIVDFGKKYALFVGHVVQKQPRSIRDRFNLRVCVCFLADTLVLYLNGMGNSGKSFWISMVSILPD
jgi:hypothetical protein